MPKCVSIGALAISVAALLFPPVPAARLAADPRHAPPAAPELPAAPEPPATIVDVAAPLHQSVADADGLYRIDGFVDRTRIRFLVDSAASLTILSRHDARRLGIDPARLRYDRTLVTAGGIVPLGFVRIADLRLAGRHHHDVRLAVMRRDSGVSLLGQDLLRRYRHVAIDSQVLTLAG